MTSSAIVQKLWNYCNVLSDDLSACEHAQADGMSYGDYPSAWLRTGSEQLTYLLFLKMTEGADARSQGFWTGGKMVLSTEKLGGA